MLATVIGLLAAACHQAPYDFDGSGQTGFVWFNETTHRWEAHDPAAPNQIRVLATGAANPGGMDDSGWGGDYDGNGRFDPAIVHENWDVDTNSPAGTIHVTRPTNSGPGRILYVFGMYGGGHRTLPSFYREADATWFIHGRDPVVFGTPAHAGGLPDWDVPVPGDYDGNGTTDIATFSPLTGEWKVLGQGTIATFGGVGTFPLQADWDGDGDTDPAYLTQGLDVHIFGQPLLVAPPSLTPSNGSWVPMPGDYDGDGRIEPGSWDFSSHTWRTSVHSDGPGGGLVAGPSLVLPSGSTPAPTLDVMALTVSIARLTVLARCVEQQATTCPGPY